MHKDLASSYQTASVLAWISPELQPQAFQELLSSAKMAHLAIDYIIKLPERSLEEFCRWVYRFMGNAQFISPEYLAEQHQKFARALIDRYSSKAI
ncbi:MAG: WYL domain-containing protein [Nostoc sp. DedQUE05]|uniref:WYL domain-containing protein n=1 Tax=Nostoc sp. DedQUE05 TaxID=3075391 RepID=UPI002AD21950|nr:WYL domain-containing protein [Nostoc sp. DedQUE05]MDZ8091185.1 WYL domain-containing protein [Nostoc sp. DedQUE05]